MPSASALALPRPNPGPERSPGPGPLAPALTLIVAAAWLAAAGWWAFRRPRDRTASRPTAAPLDTSPTMPALAEIIRAELVARLGPSWSARTREELTSAPEVAAMFGPGQAEMLARFLHDADRAKFAAAPDQGPAWAGWVADFLAAGASSTTTGK